MVTDSLDPNLLQTAKRPKNSEQNKEKLGAARLISRRNRILKILAYGFFFLTSLVFFALVKIPDAAITNLFLNSLNQNSPYLWQADRVSLGLFLTPHLNLNKLTLEPKFPGSGIPLSLDQIQIYPDPLALIPIGGSPSIGASFKAEGYRSFLRGYFSSGTNLAVKLESDSIDLSRLQPLTQSGIDLKGTITNLFLKINLPNQRLSASDGEILIQAKNVVFDPSALGLPMALPILNLGDVEISGQLSRGQLKLEKIKIGSAGKDLQIQVPSGLVVLSDVMANTRYDLHLLVKPSASMEKVVPGLGSMLASMATVKPDGFYAMKIQGTLGAPGFPTKD